MITVTVPATSANVGAGFDSLGLAVSMYNVFTFEEADRIQITSVDGTHIPTGSNNLVYRSAKGLFDKVGKTMPPLKLVQTNAIPMARGLGSSSACIIAGLLGLLGVRLFIKVIQIKPYILTPIIFVLCILGSYALRNNMFDVGAMLLIAVVGYFFLKLEIPIAPIVLALILGPLAESNLRRSLLLSQGSASIFFTRPICIFFLVLALVSLCWPLLRKLLSGRKKQA